MQIVTTLSELRSARAQMREPVGLVPTMGYLHEGHLSLVHRARAECASVVVSIFVNPTQFSPNEDLSTYPRDLPSDLQLLKVEGVDVVWTPTPSLMYPPTMLRVGPSIPYLTCRKQMKRSSSATATILT